MKQIKGLRKNKVAAVGLILVPVVLVAAALALFSMLPQSNGIQIEGSIEISTSPYFSQVSGTVDQIPVRTGQSVKAGDILAKIDSQGLDNEIEQLKAALIMKQVKLRELTREEVIDAKWKAAQSSVDICREQITAAERDLQNAKLELEMQTKLFEEGFLPHSEWNRYQTAVEEKASALAIAEAQLDAAQSSLDVIISSEKNANEIAAAQADVHLTELQIERLKRNKEDYVLKALKDGVVVSRSIDPGAIVMAGQSLFELSNEDDHYVVFYLPEDYVNAVAFGDELELYKFNGKEIIGTGNICYMDWKAIYTPKDFETGSNKNKRSVKIKALVQTEEDLNVGETIITRVENEN